MSKYTITYIDKVPLFRKILGILCLLLTLISLIDLYILPFITLLTLSIVLLKTKGSEIDLASKTYRTISSFLGIKIGSWKSLPKNIEYISVFSTSISVTVRVVTAETTNSYPIIILNLFYDRNKKIEVYKTEDKDEAFQTALHIADALEINMLDATVTADFKWMNKDAYREKGEFVYD